MAFAKALDRLISAECPMSSPETLRQCVRGERLMEYVRAATDEAKGRYEILQMQR